MSAASNVHKVHSNSGEFMREENDRLERRGFIIELFYLKVVWFYSVNSSPFNNVKINMRTKFEGGIIL